jgi:hypothetical protein
MPEPPSDFQQAREKLRAHGGYDWLLDGQAFWSTMQVVESLKSAGMPISNDLVAKWFRSLPHTQDLGGRAGLFASKNDLIRHFASLMPS